MHKSVSWMLLWSGVAAAQGVLPPPVISVSSMGKATAKADLAIVFLTVRSSAPLAADALEQTKRKAEEVRQKLAGLGYQANQVKFSGNRFSPAGGGVYYPGGQRPTGFDVYNNVFVVLEGEALKDVDALNSRVSSILDELGKIGVTSTQMPISSMSMGGASIVAFTVKDPAPYEKQAHATAMDKARAIGDDLAARMKVRITGIESVISGSMARTAFSGGPQNPLDDLPYEYYSSSLDEVPVRVRVDVRYAYKPGS